MGSSDFRDPHRPGIFGAGIGVRIAVAAAVVAVLWAAAAWAVTSHARPAAPGALAAARAE